MTKYYIGIGPAYGIHPYSIEFEGEVVEILKNCGAKIVDIFHEYECVEIEFESDENTNLDAISDHFEMYISNEHSGRYPWGVGSDE